MVTSTTITERGSISSPSYTARDAISSPSYSARGTVTNPYYQGSSETCTDETPPTLSNFAARVISDTYCEFDWDTDEPATCLIQYGTTNPPGGTDSAVSHTHLIISNRIITASGLTKDTTYYIRAQSADAYGNVGGAGAFVFTSAGDDGAGGRPIEP